MNPDLYIVGADLEIIDLAESLGRNIAGVIDRLPAGSDYYGYTVLGDDDWWLNNAGDKHEQGLAITLDAPDLRRKLFEMYSSAGFQIDELMGTKPRRGFQSGIGTVIQHPAHISVNVSLGNCVKINCGANVMHDVRIGDYSTIAPNAVLLGYVEIGSACFIGAGATILPRVKIDDGVTVGAGAVVTKDVASGLTVKGVPAKS